MTLDQKHDYLFQHRDKIPRDLLIRYLDDWAMDSGYTSFKGDDALWTWENIKEENAN